MEEGGEEGAVQPLREEVQGLVWELLPWSLTGAQVHRGTRCQSVYPTSPGLLLCLSGASAAGLTPSSPPGSCHFPAYSLTLSLSLEARLWSGRCHLIPPGRGRAMIPSFSPHHLEPPFPGNSFNSMGFYPLKSFHPSSTLPPPSFFGIYD